MAPSVPLDCAFNKNSSALVPPIRTDRVTRLLTRLEGISSMLARHQASSTLQQVSSGLRSSFLQRQIPMVRSESVSARTERKETANRRNEEDKSKSQKATAIWFAEIVEGPTLPNGGKVPKVRKPFATLVVSGSPRSNLGWINKRAERSRPRRTALKCATNRLVRARCSNEPRTAQMLTLCPSSERTTQKYLLASSGKHSIRA